MKRQLQQKWLVRLAIVLAIIVILVGWSAAANYGATSLRVIGTRFIPAGMPDTGISADTYPLHFDKTLTDLGFVNEIQDQMGGLPRGIEGGCNIGSVDYRYEFIFSTLGITTQVYSGTNNCALWQVETFGWIPSVTPTPYSSVESPIGTLPILSQIGLPTGS
jgi:hypothetical protein